jgi:hypothetical protein
MTMVTRIAQAFGAVFVLVGILGLVATGGVRLAADPPPAMLLGLFPVNLTHNVVHFAVGVWALLAARSYAMAKTFCQVGGVAYLGLAALGFVAPTMFGLIPIGGHDIWLHAATGATLAGVGFSAKTPAASAA